MTVKRSVLAAVIPWMVMAVNGFAGGEEAIQETPSLFERIDHLLDEWGKPKPVYGEQVKIKVGGEFRYRLELRDDFNFNDATHEDDAVNLIRSRLSLDFIPGPYLRVFAEAQDSESFAASGLHKTTSFVNRFDLYRLYGEITSPLESIPLKMSVGRQTLFYGDDRFISFHNDTWSNVPSLIDAVKLVYTPKKWLQADLWYGQPVLVNRSQADSADHSENLYGLYTTLGPFHDQTLDTFLFIRHNLNNEIAGERPGERGQLKEYTVGNRFKGRAKGFDYGIEYAIQSGSRAHDDIKAWAWHNEMGYTFEEISGDPRIDFEYNFGSGDSDPTNGTFENFDNLFPGNHQHYGFIDFVGLRNIHTLKLGSQIKPHKRIKLSAGHHWFFLDTNKSAWFTQSGTGTIRAAQANASTTLGQEIDLLAKWQLSQHLSLTLGYSHFHAGAFIKDTGAHDNANFFYVQEEIKF